MRNALERAASFLARQTDKLDVGMWFLHDVKRCLQSRCSQLTSSLTPGAVLNILLCGTLAILDFALPTGFAEARPLSYMLIMSCGGGLAYALAFLFVPIPQLASESLRWRKFLRLKLETL